MDFQRLLLQIGESLSSEEVRALVFLCKDISQRRLSSVELFSELCLSLSDQELLSPDRPQLLQELLLAIDRPRLVRGIPVTEQVPQRDFISPYRKLLYNLSEDITNQDLKKIKFLLNQKLPRRKLDENITTLELFLEMEQMDLLGETNLDLLQSVFESVCPVLNEKINHFKQQESKATYANSAFEEINSLAAVSYHVGQSQHDLKSSPWSLYGGSNVSGSQSLTQSIAQVSISPPNASAVTRVALKTSAESTDIPKNPTLHLHTEATNVEELGSYPMTGKTRGICLIVNNDNFSDRKRREGTKIDQECLEQVFQWLGFEVEVHHDCTVPKMLSVAEELSSRDHRNMDCVVCCFLSHGLQGGIYGVDGQTVSIKQLTKLFNGSQCPSLVDKPKLFFIQACQGTDEQQAVSIETDGPTPCTESDAAKVEKSIPCDADFLLGMATVPSFVSYRETSSGTWFIQALCKNLIQMIPSGLDLVSILTKVNADVSQKTGYYYGPKKQMPQPAFSLRKKVIFPVPSAPPPNL